MIILACNDLCLSFGTETILDKACFVLQQNEKAGLVGVNGAGKSTLYKIITNRLQQDSGEIYISKSLRVGCLDQDSGLESDNTIWGEMLTVYAALTSIEARLKLLEKSISSEKDEGKIQSIVKQYDALLERYSREGGYEYNSRIKGILRGLGFEESQFEMSIKTLSGGQKTRLALAKLLLDEPELLLLDEPTNHLDIAAIEWLEEFIRNYKYAVLVISHDRYFLDAVTSKTIELENFQCTTYNGNYSAYAEQKAINREIEQKHYDQQQKEIARMEAFIEQQKQWNRERNIKAAESRQKAIGRIEKLDIPKKLPGSIKLKFNSSIKGGVDVLNADGLSKSFPGNDLFNNISFNIKRKERVFLIGPNGCGKSTLIKIFTGKISQTAGTFRFGHNIIPGYYDQELEGLNEKSTILEEVWNGNEKLTHTQVRNVLAQFLFIGEDVYKEVRVLSGGEKSRVALAKLMLSGANLLLLDEPTNHLDINSREALEDALSNFEGTLFIVSHDRYFIKKLATRILEMTKNGLEDYHGDYQYYVEHRRESLPADETTNNQSVSESKKDHIQSKEERARKRKLEKQLAACEKEIKKVESRLAKISDEMGEEAVQCDHLELTALVNEQSELESRLEHLYEEWTNASEQL